MSNIYVRNVIQQTMQRHARSIKLASANKRPGFDSAVRRALPFSPLAHHMRRLGSTTAGTEGHVWDEFVATHPGQSAMRGMAAELLGSDKVVEILQTEEMHQAPIVDSAEDEKLVRMGIAASFRREVFHDEY